MPESSRGLPATATATDADIASGPPSLPRVKKAASLRAASSLNRKKTRKKRNLRQELHLYNDAMNSFYCTTYA